MASEVDGYTVQLRDQQDQFIRVWAPWQSMRLEPRVKTYQYQTKAHRHPIDFTPLLLTGLVPALGLAWLERYPDVMSIVMDAFNGQIPDTLQTILES